MQSLHLVGFTEARDGLVFATEPGGRGRFVVPVDDALLDHLAGGPGSALAAGRDGELGPARAMPARPSPVASALSPREVQARLRAGASIADVAAAAGVADEWVERFAAPVFAEQAAAVARAVELPLSTPRRGVSARPLGEAVVRGLAARGVRLTPEEIGGGWSAYQLQGAEWVVAFSYRWRGRESIAEWIVDLAGRTLVGRTRTASDLGWSGAPEERAAAPTSRATGRAASGKAASADAASGKAVSGKAVSGKAVSGKAAPAKAAGRKAVSGKAAPAKAGKAVARKVAAESRDAANGAAPGGRRDAEVRQASPPAPRPAAARPVAPAPATPPAPPGSTNGSGPDPLRAPPRSHPPAATPPAPQAATPPAPQAATPPDQVPPAPSVPGRPARTGRPLRSRQEASALAARLARPFASPTLGVSPALGVSPG